MQPTPWSWPAKISVLTSQLQYNGVHPSTMVLKTQDLILLFRCGILPLCYLFLIPWLNPEQKWLPFTTKISLVNLLTVCHTVLAMLVWRIRYWINLISSLIFFFILLTCVLHILYGCWKKKLCLDHSESQRFNI